MTSDPNRRPWQDGPHPDAPAESWLSLEDDDLLHRIETVGDDGESDPQLLEIVQSDRHFFIRQEAAKKIHKKTLLFAYEDDRHVGQILVRHLTRREDVTYLERLVARSQHAEVRAAAQAQLARLRKKYAEPARLPHEAGAQPAPPMTWRVAIIHSDAALRQVVGSALPHPEFAVAEWEPGTSSLAEMEEFDPHLVMADVTEATAGTPLADTLRERTPQVPLVALCTADSADSLIDILGNGADEFLVLPVDPSLLTAKTRALVHFAHRTTFKAEPHILSGNIGPEGALPLFKLCQEQRLTCRLVVITDDEQRFVDFVAGEMADSGGDPPVPEEEALAALLAIRSGLYQIVEQAASAETPPETPPPAATQGIVVRPVTPPTEAVRVPPSSGGREDVDVTLLGWAAHFVVEEAWPYLGTTVTTGLLRRTQREHLVPHPVLGLFSVGEDGHVQVDLSRGARLPRGAVVAVALWMAAFLAEARHMVPETATIDVRGATMLMNDALEQAGFYAAFDLEARRLWQAQPTSIPIASITPQSRS